MDKNICVILQYDGTRYSGWQRQGNTDNTIEHKLSAVLSAMLQNKVPVEIHGSGRTDAGVHAMGQVANFHIDTDMEPDAIISYMNKYLPEDIRVIHACEKDARFHARLSAVKKTYIYRIDNNPKADVFIRRYAWSIQEILDLDKMKELTKLFLGEHDFISFSDMKSGKKSTVRRIDSIDLYEEDGIISISYTGNGFLYHMVRKLTAAFVAVGLGQMTIDDVKHTLEMKDRLSFKSLAPAKGLVLKDVQY